MDGKDAAEADELILQLAMGVGIKGNSFFREDATFSCVTAAGLGIFRSDAKFSEKFKAAAEATTHGVLILAKTVEEYEAFLSKGQAHADALENDHVRRRVRVVGSCKRARARERVLARARGHREQIHTIHHFQVWVLTEDGIFPRRGANKSKGKKDGMIYYGDRDEDGESNAHGLVCGPLSFESSVVGAQLACCIRLAPSLTRSPTFATAPHATPFPIV